MLKCALTVIMSLTFSATLLANEKKTDWNLVELCKKDCPKAKSDEEAHKCAEKIGKLNKEFRKGQCWEANEKYEAASGKAHE